MGIFGGWGTGKTTLMHMVEDELKKNYPLNVVTIWFDSWRYENEEYSAMIPLLRTITLGLEDVIKKMKNGTLEKKRIKNVKDKFFKLGVSIARNISINAGIKTGNIAEAGAAFDLRKIADDYHSDGYFMKGQERIYYHKHITDRLKEEFQKIRHDVKAAYDFRIVIFVDDLDRCTPEKALEVIESIKTFFDIEGIVYVLGMDSRTIDPIIATKYGKKHTIDGMDYLQKIVQLPFQIPVWNATDLSRSIKQIVEKTGMPIPEIDQILDNTSIDLITLASQLNPRDVKRFINSHIILARYIYGQSIDDIKKIIAVQAFYFRGKKWLNFLKLITPYEARTRFFKYILMLLNRPDEVTIQAISTLEGLKNLINDINNRKQKFILDLDKPVSELFKKIIDLRDNELWTFLMKATRILLKIDNIDKYIRATEIMEISERSDKSSGVSYFDRKTQLQVMKRQNPEEFNRMRAKTVGLNLIHFPIEDLSSLNLMGIDLSHACLCFANMNLINLHHALLDGADLSLADLSHSNLGAAEMSLADLRGADLTRANLTSANLFGANLSWTDLGGADLTGANLVGANLTGSETFFDVANFSGADLRNSNLNRARLNGVNLKGANLSQADLKCSNLTGANLTGANLTGANLTGAILIDITKFKGLKTGYAESENTDFKDAIIDNNSLVEYLLLKKNNVKNLPQKIRDKLDLKTRLEQSKCGLAEGDIHDYLEMSKIV